VGKRLESCVRKALHNFNLLQGISHLGVALSGGKDSVALLILLHAIRGRGFPDFKLSAFHIGGAFTCGAGIGESFIRSICDELSIPLTVEQSSKQTLDGLECYSCSRERRTLLFKAAKEAGCQAIAFGHHRDDLVQTLLLNLLHKGEFAGMLPSVTMHNYGIKIIRPLLLAEEKDVIQFAKLAGFSRITCRCPVGQNSMRKQVEKLLEECEALFPNARKNLSDATLRYGSNKANDLPKKQLATPWEGLNDV
jgi:tRNA(Ile)-lysidine synthase TilS/MesJ